ncbi:MAG: exodeoxyribonuclease VII large subunit [Acidobacteria bacterium]|nr:exodeoxyribonuclease VII large subunit [Acidobacteriota bacterium]
MSSLFDLPFEDEPAPDNRPTDAGAPDGRQADAGAPLVGARNERTTTRPAERPRESGTGHRAPGTGFVERESERQEPRRPRTYTVSELTHAVRQSLEGTFGRVWVEGEIADCTPSQGNVYFTLKDGGAQVSAVLWRTDAARLRFKLTTGLHVLVKGRLSVYVPRGRYQLIVDSIEPKGAGARQLALDQLKKRLQAEGLFDPARKRALPMLPRRIGVVTSLDGAAVRDILRVLRTRRAPADIVIAPTRVQGEGASVDIARAIARVARVPDVDVIIVGRGGGSTEDLWAFNEETVARAVAAAPVPVIAAVGHEVDTTLADYVADVRAATPSQAAEIVVRQASDFRDRLAGAQRQMALLLGSRLDRQRTRLLRIEGRPGFAHYRDEIRHRDRLRVELTDRLAHAWRERTARRTRRLADLAARLDEQHPQRQLVTRVRRLTQIDDRLRSAMTTRRAAAHARLQASRERLARVGLDARVAQSGRRVDHLIGRGLAALTRTLHTGDRRVSSLSGQLDALSPLRTLARGYAICWDTPGQTVVRSVAGVSTGDRVHVQVSDGMLQCDVAATSPDSPPRP